MSALKVFYAQTLGPAKWGAVLSRKHKQLDDSGTGQEYSRSDATAKYMKKRHKRTRHHVFAVVAVTLVVSLFAFVGVAWAYINGINSRLARGVSQDTLKALTEVQDGEPFYILLLGIDKDQDRANGTEYGPSDSSYRSDSIMLARVDPKEIKVTLVSIHRDILVDLDEYGQQKINAAFTFGGAPYSIKTIEKLAGVKISHYAEVDMDGLAKVVDTVGGIDVDLPVDVKDSEYTGIDLKKGHQHINGKEATLLCRARHAYDEYGDGDRYRAANQRMVIGAVIKKVLRSDPGTMTAAISSMADMVTTDMNVNSILGLATSMSSLDVDKNVVGGMTPTTSDDSTGTWYEILDVEAWKHMMERVDQGLSPYDGNSYDDTAGIAAKMGKGD